MRRLLLWTILTGVVALSREGSMAVQGTQGHGGGRAPGRVGTGQTSTMGMEAERSTATSFEQVKAWIAAYRAAHPGNRGKDWDINAKTPAQIAADPAAQQLLSICGRDQRPVIPLLAWEYGGSDHQWIDPQRSALVYCVFTPIRSSTPNWTYDAARDHITADVYVRFPDQNPCQDREGADKAVGCIGDPTNFEILVDTASINDGRDVGLRLANASTELRLVLPDGTKVHLWEDK